MKALVTGGGGFLGCYIVEQLLARGDSVVVFARRDYPELSKIGAKLTRGDICDPLAIQNACVGIDTVFHVAAMEGLWGKWESFYQPNVIGTQNVIQACLRQGVGKLIYTSSPSVIFDNSSQEGCDERLPYPSHYESYYAKTKALGEQMISKAHREGLLTVSLRPHLIWGPRDTHILPQVIALAKAGQVLQVGDGRNMVDFTYVEDAARAHILAADALYPGSNIAGSVYFISQDDPVKLWPWVNNLLSRLGIPKVNRKITLRQARTIGMVLESAYRILPLKGEPRLTRFLASELALSHYYDISRAKRDFNYQPQFTMEQGLEKTLVFFTQNLRY
jgi:nucleoside-diphosphate-sugar epimerase